MQLRCTSRAKMYTPGDIRVILSIDNNNEGTIRWSITSPKQMLQYISLGLSCDDGIQPSASQADGVHSGVLHESGVHTRRSEACTRNLACTLVWRALACALTCMGVHSNPKAHVHLNVGTYTYTYINLHFVHDGRTDRNFSEMPGKLCFARLSWFKRQAQAQTKLGYP
eukprot:scaffold31721_cov72-Skeletonema_dohrnii-CCMP3373.AAC.1